MGNKYVSIMLILALIISALATIVSSNATGLLDEDKNVNVNQPTGTGSLTSDNDNSFDKATELFNRSKVTGDLDVEDDPLDYYKIYLERPGRKGDLMEVNFIPSGFFTFAAIYFFNPEMYRIGDEIASSQDPIQRYIFTVTEGWYYMVVTPYWYTQQLDYEISIAITERQFTSDSDNTNDTADPVNVNGHDTSNLDTVRDYLDLYNITLNADGASPEALEIELFSKEDKYLAVYNPDGTLRMESDLGDSDEGDKEIIKFAASETGTYRIAVGISGAPSSSPFYLLNTTIITSIPPDKDFDEEHATRVYNGTIIETSFDSEYDLYDYFVMELNDTDNLTVSILYEPGPGDLDIDIYDEVEKESVNLVVNSNSERGVWTWGVADMNETDYYIVVQNYETTQLVNYSILFSLNAQNLWFKPMVVNDTNKDFSMLEDSIDVSHVNLTEIFYDPDSPITYGSPTHPGGFGTNMNMDILINGTVKFMPHEDFHGDVVCNFSAIDIDSNIEYWDVNVNVLPVNDVPVIKKPFDQIFYFGEIHIDEDNIFAGLDLNKVFWDPSDLDALTFSVTGEENITTEIAMNGTVKFIPLANWSGEEELTFKANDSSGGNVSDNLTIIVEPKNDAPKFVTIGGFEAKPSGVVELNATEDTWNNFTINVSDVDHDIGIIDYLDFADLWFSDDVADPEFSIDTKTGNISFFPLQKHVGTFDVIISVVDGEGAGAEQDIRINVLNINDAPGVPEVNLIKQIDSTINCSVNNVFDEDGDTITYTWDYGDGTISKDSGRYGNHTYSEIGVYNITVSASDGIGGISVDILNINITSLTKDVNGGDGDGGDGDGGDGDGDGGDNITKPFVDNDNDTLDDNWEEYFFKNLSINPEDDSDEDGYTNYEEYIAKTDPTNPYDIPTEEPKINKQSTSDTSDLESMLYIVAIIAIINFVLVIILISIIMMRKKHKKGAATTDSRVPYSRKNGFTIPCPECGRDVAEDAHECPYCRERLELPGDSDYDYEPRDSRSYDRHRQPTRGRGADSRTGVSWQDERETEDDFRDEREYDEDYEDEDDEYDDDYEDDEYEDDYEDEEFEDDYEDEEDEDVDYEDDYEDEEDEDEEFEPEDEWDDSEDDEFYDYEDEEWDSGNRNR